jgi:hypothetical protein
MDPLNTVALPGAAAVSKGGYAYYYEELIPAGHSTSALIQTIVGDAVYTLGRVLTDDKLDYVAQLAVPLLGLLFVGRGKILLLYGALLTLLATRPFVHTVHFQYSALLVPFVFFLSASALGEIRSGRISLGRLDPSRLTKALGVGIIVSSALCSWKFGAALPNDSFRAGFRPLSRATNADLLGIDRWLRNLSRTLPKGARVAANSRLLTHLGTVTNLFLFDDGLDVDYVVAGMDNPAVAKVVKAQEARGELVLMDSHGAFRVYKATHIKRPRLRGKKAPPKPLEDD